MMQSIDAIAENLKAERESRGLSLEQLAELTGVSKSMLRQIETGKSSPTVATMWKIANGLRVSFTALMSRRVIAVEVKSFRGENPITDQGEHYRVYPLVSFNPQQSFEIYYLEIDPGTSFEGEPHQGNVHEYLFVTRGSLVVSVADKEYAIGEGEFLQFPANCRHGYRCTSEEMAQVIMQLNYHL
ncbi:MAG: helix-turn-helix domain-containing protein [Syntrophobacteraceae bacterium]